MSEEISICTIIAKNYLAHARTLTDSFLKNNPSGKIFVLLVDELSEHFKPENEKFTLVSLDDIGIKNLKSFLFKYTILEQNTGVKANFLKYLFKKFQLKKLAYFDPDILFTNSLDNLWQVLDEKSIVLTPHITMPYFDDKRPSEYDIMRSGVYNLGFIALSNTETTKKFLDWWIPHLMEAGYNDVDKGMFTDQKWIDFVPAIFDDVYIIRHPGYNVAYWNLMHRDVKIVNGKIDVENKPVYFFHFSGFNPENMEKVSKHQNRFQLKDLEKIRKLFELYRDNLVENGYLDIKKWECKFQFFDNGVKISDEMRDIYRDELAEGRDFNDPFNTSESNSFFEYLNSGIDNKKPKISRLMYKIFKKRKDLHTHFLDPINKDREAFSQWCLNSLEKEYQLDKVFLPKNIQKKINPEKSENQSEELKSMIQDNIGINIIGYFQGEFGVAEAARNFVKACKAANIPHVLINVTTPHHRNNDKTFTDFSINNPYPINLLVTNADQTDFFIEKLGKQFFENKYNIGIWSWELEEFPKKWLPYLKHFDEIWTMSSYMTNNMEKVFPVPVITMTVPISFEELKVDKKTNRFNLKNDEFIFLMIFDYASISERKNPIGTIKSFNEAFTKNENVRLIIKSINGTKFSEQEEELKKLTKQENISYISEHFSKDEILELLSSCECYVSLHRAEGLGLNIIEAMFAKKLVIATDYGGNRDIMNTNNSFPVKYQMTKIEKDLGPYKKGNYWAEPNIKHAAYLMKYVYENRSILDTTALNASEFIKNNLSYAKIGEKIKQRIVSIPTKYK